MKLKKYIEYYSTGEIYYICLIDEEGCRQGEYISYNKNGNIYFEGFLKNNTFIGKYYHNKKYYFKSLISYKQYFSEAEHKKELAMIRLGLIEEPVEFSYFLKDYDEKGKINN
jgi:hypothetical protein